MSSPKRFKFSGITSTKPADVASKTPLIVRFYDGDIQARDSRGRTQEEILDWPDSQLESCHNYIQMLFPVPEGSAFNWEAPIIDRATIDAFRSRSDLRNRLRRSFERMLEFYGFAVEMQREKEKDASKGKDSAKVEDTTDTEGTEEAVDTTDVKDITEVKRAEDEQKEATADAKAETESSATNAQDAASKSEATTSSSKSSFPAAITSYTSQFSYNIVRGSNFRRNSRNWAVRFDHNHLRITRILRCLRILGLQTECNAFFKALKEVYDDPAIKISERSLTYWSRAVTRPLYIAPDDDEIEWLKEFGDE